MADDPRADAVRSETERIARQLASDALEEAAGRARAILVERLTETLVAEAERCLEAQPAPAASAGTAADERASEELEAPERDPVRAPMEADVSTHADASEQASGCYLFAIAQAAGPPLPSLEGMEPSSPVREVVTGQLAAVVCEIPLGLFDGLDQEPVGPESRLADLARRHDDVVRGTFERRTVLPLRFGTVLSSERQLVQVLGEEQAQLVAELRRLEGKAEWTCRLSPDPVAAAAAVRQKPARAGGAAYLAERERELAATDDEDPYGVVAAAERLSQAVEPHVESALPQDPAGEEARVSFLVPDQDQERFAAAVAAVAEASPTLRIELLGPHPPYHFATVRLGTEVP